MDFGKQSRSKIKKYIIINNLLPYKCDICLLDKWNNKNISLHLDHIDGVNTNNKLSNLRFLCPNCHSQTESYCGNSNKKSGHYNKKTYKVEDDELIDAIKKSSSIKEALDYVGLSGSNNYNRVKKIAKHNNLLHIFKFVDKHNKNKDRIILLKKSNIDFTKYGWVKQASVILKITPQKTRKFIEKNAPELLLNANKRKLSES